MAKNVNVTFIIRTNLCRRINKERAKCKRTFERLYDVKQKACN